VTAKGAPTYQDAHTIASKISTSTLVKTALSGEDAKWARIPAPTGSITLALSAPTNVMPVADPSMFGVTIVPADGTSSLPLMVNGEPETVEEDHAKEIMTEEDLSGLGEAEARYGMCDLSYVRIRSIWFCADANVFIQEYVRIYGNCPL
jgi:glutamate N-acetyltransferase / amino-acid N-acetyltransferase